MTNVDFSTLIDAYMMVLGEPIYIGLFVLILTGIICVRFGVSTPFIFVCAIASIYLLTAYLPEAILIVALFVVGTILFFGLMKIIGIV